MSAQAVIDSLEFARTGQTLRGSLSIPGLARLQDSLHDTSGQVEFAVRGGLDARHRPILALEIAGMLHLRCQRCLESLDYPLQLANTVLLVSETQAGAGELDEEEESESEWIVASPALKVPELIEDEIILSLPYAPRHGKGVCARGAAPAPVEPRVATFEALSSLRKNRN
jgi:uncharacterized protein